MRVARGHKTHPSWQAAVRAQARAVADRQMSDHKNGAHTGAFDRHARRGCPLCQERTPGNA